MKNKDKSRIDLIVEIGKEFPNGRGVEVGTFKGEFSKKIMKDVESGKIVAFDAALSIHHYFETIHPFIDGNGRTGRLLLQKVLTDLGEDPAIIFFDDRSEYYDAIQNFRVDRRKIGGAALTCKRIDLNTAGIFKGVHS